MQVNVFAIPGTGRLHACLIYQLCCIALRGRIHQRKKASYMPPIIFGIIRSIS
jgi:hypothetical protein